MHDPQRNGRDCGRAARPFPGRRLSAAHRPPRRPRPAQGIGDIACDGDFDCRRVRVRRLEESIRVSRSRSSAARLQVAASSASSSRKPSAWPSPAPPSLVALPPMPTMSRSRSCCDRRQKQLAGAASCRDERIALFRGTRTSPEAAAISITAVRPSPEQAELGATWLASRPGNQGLAQGAAGGSDQGVDRSFTAIGHRHEVNRCFWTRSGARRAPSPRRPRPRTGFP